jgi:hypothetical protein
LKTGQRGPAGYLEIGKDDEPSNSAVPSLQPNPYDVHENNEIMMI